MRKSLMLQAEMAEAGHGRAVFDVTLDLEMARRWAASMSKPCRWPS